MAWIRLDLAEAEILFSDRTGGVSAPPFDTANAGYSRGDDPANVDENRGRIGAALGGRGADPVDWVSLHQLHGARVYAADRFSPATPRTPGGRSAARPAPQADASVSAEAGAVLSVLTADCGPVALVAPGVVAAVHAGWRGVSAGVLEAAVAEVRQRTAGPVRAVLGPCIHPECYEFSPADLQPITERLGPDVVGETSSGLPALDVPRAIRLALAGAGVTDVTDVDVCTACSSDHFSHRRDGRTGLQTMLVAAK
ncbi:MAG: purine-nucleoside/S-methyl-5-thioadenosine phosphorylase / adenosine deaminase [Actinomycetota bacterium]|nr:purine-nucleoside/S-methyl-5-thioadenosine phosphorylase / adenosine deaminase [Actinomycetota bacterium]